MICLRRRNKVQRPEAIEAALFVGFLELLLKLRLHCRRTATASLFLVRNRTSDSTRIPVWISLPKPGSADRSFAPLAQGANACGISCATVGLCPGATVLGSIG